MKLFLDLVISISGWNRPVPVWRNSNTTMAESESYHSPSKSNGTACNSEVYRVEERPEHGMRILHALNKLKTDKILCDVTLIAERK